MQSVLILVNATYRFLAAVNDHSNSHSQGRPCLGAKVITSKRNDLSCCSGNVSLFLHYMKVFI